MILAKYPFVGYAVYKVFHKKAGRYYAYLNPIDKSLKELHFLGRVI